MQDNSRPNLLINEQSPYLLQHAYNPVQWFPWSDEAFAKAALENKPVFVSIGYATCHWCHVMAHESFENNDVAEYLNEHFISVKVDREERPDVDAFCMDVCQSLTGHGGWPLTIMMDAERRPFFAGTYFPRVSTQNRMGFLDLLQRLAEVWRTDKERIIESADEISRAVREAHSIATNAQIRNDVFSLVADQHRRMFDSEYGGFSVNPKFPSPQHMLLLLRIAHRTGESDLVDMVCKTLDEMRFGGIYDHVGFGFHRYSTDRKWFVPHFEKMVYDQAMLMMAYTEAWQVTKRELYRQTVFEIAEYVMRDLRSSEGAFYSAQDADSEGEEGKFYVWHESELGEDAAWLKGVMGVESDGNFHDEVSGEQSGANILFVKSRREMNGVESGEWRGVRERLFKKRIRRVAPITDTKILADWNGMMIMALAQAGRAFEDPGLIDAAVNAYSAVTLHCKLNTEKPQHTNGIPAFLDDHACMGNAAVELYQATGNSEYLHAALLHAAQIESNFVNSAGQLTIANTRVVGPNKQFVGRSSYDSAYPSGNSFAAMLFVGLGAIQHDDDWTDKAIRLVSSQGQTANEAPSGFCMLLCAWDVLVNEYYTVEFFGNANSNSINELKHAVNSAFLPGWYQLPERTSDDKTYGLICSPTECSVHLTTAGEVKEFINGLYGNGSNN